MSMEHKAYVFDYEAFERELASILRVALERNDCTALIEFIENNLESLKDPYQGEPLSSCWQSMIETRDSHQYGSFALTKYYDPRQNIGLYSDWRPIHDAMERETGDAASILLGDVFGSASNSFDPYKIGSFFQSSRQVERNLCMVQTLAASRPELSDLLGPARSMLQRPASEGKGLYIAF
jgi:hypothetical protein